MDEVDLIIGKIDATEEHAKERFNLIRDDFKVLDGKVDNINDEVIRIATVCADIPRMREAHSQLKATVNKHITSAEVAQELGVKGYAKKYSPPTVIIIIVVGVIDYFVSGGLI